MDYTYELAKASLPGIVSLLKSGDTEHALAELEFIADDKHEVAACLANYFHGAGMSRSVSYITSEDIGRPIQDEIVIKVTIEYAPESECAKQEA